MRCSGITQNNDIAYDLVNNNCVWITSSIFRAACMEKSESRGHETSFYRVSGRTRARTYEKRRALYNSRFGLGRGKQPSDRFAYTTGARPSQESRRSIWNLSCADLYARYDGVGVSARSRREKHEIDITRARGKSLTTS